MQYREIDSFSNLFRKLRFLREVERNYPLPLFFFSLPPFSTLVCEYSQQTYSSLQRRSNFLSVFSRFFLLREDFSRSPIFPLCVYVFNNAANFLFFMNSVLFDRIPTLSRIIFNNVANFFYKCF